MIKRILFTIVITTFLPGIYISCKNFRKLPEKIHVDGFITISKKYPRYFETTDGKTWIPVMINYIIPNGKESDVFNSVEEYFRNFSQNGGNAVRIWISSPFLEIEDTKAGQYNQLKFRRLDHLLDLAGNYHLRIKFTLQHIRTIGKKESWSNSKVLSSDFGGPFKNMNDYINAPEGKKSYLDRVRALSEKYKNRDEIFGWELWNEMDAVSGADWIQFTSEMLDSVKVLFPHHLVTQTLGSLHSYDAEKRYERLFQFKNNDFVSLHRYLDPGKAWNQYDKITKPVDLIVYDAVKLAESEVRNKPVVVNEIGAVEPDHTGPSTLYSIDTAGVLIHDMIFGPFFCGSAGTGALWHWDIYVNRQNLWYHYGRFRNMMKNIDPVQENFVPFTITKAGIRCYGLRGKLNTIIWCRDTTNNWKTELSMHIAPLPVRDFSLQLNETGKQFLTSLKTYDPWNNKWTDMKAANDQIKFPEFTRSIILIVEGKHDQRPSL